MYVCLYAPKTCDGRPSCTTLKFFSSRSFTTSSAGVAASVAFEPTWGMRSGTTAAAAEDELNADALGARNACCLPGANRSGLRRDRPAVAIE